MTGKVITASVRLDQIRAHPINIRRDLGDLRPLAESIRRDGILVPVIVDADGDMLRLRDGHRRVAAARLAGLTRIPATIHQQRLTDAEWLRHAVTINNQRRNQAAAERAETVRRMRLTGVSFAEIAAAYGVDRRTVANWIDPPDEPRQRKEGTPEVRRIRKTVLEEWIAIQRARTDATASDVLDALADLLLGTPNPASHPRRMRLADRLATIDGLLAGGQTDWQLIAADLGLTPFALEMSYRRAGRPTPQALKDLCAQTRKKAAA